MTQLRRRDKDVSDTKLVQTRQRLLSLGERLVKKLNDEHALASNA